MHMECTQGKACMLEENQGAKKPTEEGKLYMTDFSGSLGVTQALSGLWLEGMAAAEGIPTASLKTSTHMPCGLGSDKFRKIL